MNNSLQDFETIKKTNQTFYLDFNIFHVVDIFEKKLKTKNHQFNAILWHIKLNDTCHLFFYVFVF